jgi:four helix bundle protein
MLVDLLTVTNVTGEFSVPGSQFSVKPNILFGRWSLSCGFRSPRICFFGGSIGRSYRDLIAWQKAMKFVIQIYEVTQKFPTEERYGITNQLRRASVSVPSNIAEGQARFSQKEFHHFLSMARGSLVEIETQLLIAKDLKYIQSAKTDVLLAAADELGRVLNGLIASIKNRAA